MDFIEIGGQRYQYYSLKRLEKAGMGRVSRLPLSLRVVLESLLRNYDSFSVTDQDINLLADWNAREPVTKEIPFRVARVLMQDFTGVPCVVDLATMRDFVNSEGLDPKIVNPVVPVELVVDHSVQVDFWGMPDAIQKNMEFEFRRNKERYTFLKWAQNAFSNFTLFPPGTGIVHQVNLEYLGRNVMISNIDGENMVYFDSLVGTDSHTTMINGLGVLGWGVGGIEAEAAMLGQPVSLTTPKVVGVKLTGRLREGVTATDLVLTLTDVFRRENVVDKFVEFFGEGVLNLTVPDRATVSNMCPEYGATAALFPVDQETLNYLRLTGRSEEHIALVEEYYKAQGMFGVFGGTSVDYSQIIEIDLDKVEPTIAGPALPWSKLDLSSVTSSINRVVEERNKRKGYPGGLTSAVVGRDGKKFELHDGDIVIAAITSCTNTSNPYLMISSGLLAKRAVELGLRVPPFVKTSSAPGSRVVTDYLMASDLLRYLEALGFGIVGYGCTTCIGNSGPLPKEIEEAIEVNDLVVSSVLSGNRNFEMRIHKDVRANYLMSPPLVVAYAIAGSVLKDLSRDPLGFAGSKPVYLRDIWPSSEEVQQVMQRAIAPEMFRKRYSNFDRMVPEWNQLNTPSGTLYKWDKESMYIQKPPFFDDFDPKEARRVQDITHARILLILGDSVTTDHISPAGSIMQDSPAGRYLIEHGVRPADFNSYGSRRGNHEVMMRGTFANTKIKNLMLPGVEGGYTLHQSSGERMSVYDAAMRYKSEGVPLVVIAGKEYGAGSSRDWAAKGPALLGVRAVVAQSFERIHRGNLIGMGVLPLEFTRGENATTLGLKGSEIIDIIGLSELSSPGATLILRVTDERGNKRETEVKARLDNQVEVEYYRNGGILNYVLRTLIEGKLKR